MSGKLVDILNPRVPIRRAPEISGGLAIHGVVRANAVKGMLGRHSFTEIALSRVLPTYHYGLKFFTLIPFFRQSQIIAIFSSEVCKYLLLISHAEAVARSRSPH